MRRTLAILGISLAMMLSLAGTALANNPPADPLPGNGEPSCFGARVGHSASEHGLTPAAKVAVHEGNIAYFTGSDQSLWPVWVPAYLDYFETNGVSVRTVQAWIRINCSDDPIIANP